MSGVRPGQVPAKPDGGATGTQLCVLLACFAGAKTAARVRGKARQGITGGGDEILDEVVVRVDAKHRR